MRPQVAAMLHAAASRGDAALHTRFSGSAHLHGRRGRNCVGLETEAGRGLGKNSAARVTTMPAVSSSRNSGIRRWQTPSRRESTMTIRTRIALGISAAALSLSLALAPAAFAQDKMGKDDGMKKDTMSKDGMKKDNMSKDDGMKKDTMSKDGMKKDDGMMKKN
jgi:pentapeptide MXKDX repeat protein